ncbi:MAG: hypothetical protein IAF08_16975 [Rhizobacter sp.]|nr:hypothetical protein [Chlorobiales bacterium]
MESIERNGNILIDLSSDEALVLLDWLYRFNEREHPSLFQDQAEQRVLWDLECVLEKLSVEIFKPDYEGLVAKAREKVRDKE